MSRAPFTTGLVLITVLVFLTCEVQAHPPWGIVVDQQGQVYFSDLETIWKIDAQGKLTVFRAGVSGKHTHELTLDESGTLYGEELAYESATERYISALWKMTPAGNFTYLLAPTDNPPKGMSIWKDRNGNMYSAVWKSNSEHETLILKRTPAGQVSALFGSAETVDKFRQVVLYSVGGMAFGDDGSLYIADGANLRKVKMDGVVTTLAGNLAPLTPSNSSTEKSTVIRLLGIAVDPQGNAFVADNDNRRVLKITPAGKATTLLSDEQPWSPSGVAFRNGNLYVLEYGFTPPHTAKGVRVRKLSADGRITLLASIDENGKPAVTENPASEGLVPKMETKQKAPYVLIGAAIGIFALSFIIWRVRRKNHSP